MKQPIVKKSIPVFLMLALLTQVNANSPAVEASILADSVNEYYEVLVENIPEPIDGYQSFQRKLAFPEGNYSRDFEANVLIWIFIDTSGKVIDYNIVNNDCEPQFCESVINAVLTTNWTPACREGEPVSVGMYLPICFKSE